jgi:hypothetical protein
MNSYTEDAENSKDGRIAKQIMLWSILKAKPKTDYSSGHPDIWVDLSGNQFGLSVWEYYGSYHPWTPTTKISHAMVVIEKLKPLWDINLGIRSKFNFCEIRHKGYPVPMDTVYIEDKRLEMAICKAALKVVESQK